MIRLSILMVLTILIFAVFLTPTYAIQLQYNLKEKALYKSTHKMSAKGNLIIDKSAVDFKINGNSTQLIRVLSREENGDMTLMSDFSIDSFIVSVAGESEQTESKSIKFNIKMTKSGKTLELKSLSEEPSGVEYFNLLSIFATLFRFPEKDLQVGDEWSISEDEMLPTGSSATSKLIGFEEIEGHSCAKIMTTVIMPLSMIPEIHMPSSKSEGTKGMKDVKGAKGAKGTKGAKVMKGMQGMNASESQQMKFEYVSYFATDLGVLLKGSGTIAVKTDYLTKGKSVGSAQIVGDISDYLVDIASNGKILLSFQDPVLDQIVSLNVDNEDLGKVILMLFKQYGANIIVDKDINIGAKVTAQLEKVSLKYALDQLLESQGYGYKKIEGGMIRIMSLEKLRAASEAKPEEPIETKIFWIKYVDPMAISTVVQQFLTDKGKAVAESEMKLVSVTDRFSNFEKLDKIISQLDRKVESEENKQKGQKEPEEQKLEPQRPEVSARTEKRLLRLNYADPDRVIALLTPLLSKNGKVYIIETSGGSEPTPKK